MSEELECGQEHLRLADAILKGGGFATSLVRLSPNLRLLVAENEYFVLGIVIAPTLDDLLKMESALAISFVNRLATEAAGPKQWDAYLVLLTTEAGSDSNHDVTEL